MSDKLIGEIRGAKSRRDLKFENKNLKHVSEKDLLTKINNRLGVVNEFNRISSELKRESSFVNYTVMFLDMIGLKKLNIDYGEGKADEFVAEAANVIASNKRPNDIVGRWGGDEFIEIIFNTKDEYETVVADRIREKSTDKIKFNILYKEFDMDEPLESAIDFVANRIEGAKASGPKDSLGRSTGNGIVVDLNKTNINV